MKRRAPFAVLALALASAALAEPPLRYRLTVGDRLIYERRATTTPLAGEGPARREIEQIQLWCVGREEDRTLVLLDARRDVDGQPQPTIGLPFQLDDSGRRHLAGEILGRFAALDDALEIVPILPIAADGGPAWTTPSDPYGRQWHCRSRGADAERSGQVRVDFRLDDTSGATSFLEQSCEGSYWFDAAGRVARVETQAQDGQTGMLTRAVTTLRQVVQHTPAWCARRGEEAQQYLKALRTEDRLLHELVNQPEATAGVLAQLDRLWAAFLSDLDARAGSPFSALAEGRRQRLRADVTLLQARAGVGRRWLHQPARPWSLQDGSGASVTSEQVRTGPVIECFWSAEAIWGLRALEPLRRLQAEREPWPPKILCYNMDEDLALARRAVARCGTGLTQLIAGPLQTVEALSEFPIVRVVDGRGLVREIWIGWQPDYAAARDLARRLTESGSR